MSFHFFFKSAAKPSMPGDLKFSTFFKAPKHSCKVILPSHDFTSA